MSAAPRRSRLVPAAPWSGFGPGKVILLGEHAVVYGHPALAGPLSWGVTATGVRAPSCALVLPKSVRGPGRVLLERAFEAAAKTCGRPRVRVSVESDLPVSMGLGSSAALAVACARLLLLARGEEGTVARVSEVAQAMEHEFHGTPSGVDHTVSVRGELLRFRRGLDGRKDTVRVVVSPRPLKVVVALVGSRPATKVTVGALRERQARWPARYARLFRSMGQLADEGALAVEEGSWEALGDAMNVNQGLLAAAGLSSLGLETALDQMRKLGALGAKLTGAGGDGGALLGLFPDPEWAAPRLMKAGLRCFTSQVAGPRTL